MNEITIQVNEQQGEIVFDLESLKNSLTELTSIYKGLIVTEDTLQGAKKDLAALRKLSKELNDRKVAVKKSYMAPYDAFEKAVKEALAIIAEPVELIDKQVKDFENKRKEEHRQQCVEIFNETVGEYAKYITFESVFKDSWLNATAKDKDIVDDVQTRVIQCKSDLQAIESLNSEIHEDLLNEYAKGGLTAAIQANTNYIKAKERAAEQQQRAEAEKPAEPVAQPEPTPEPQQKPAYEPVFAENVKRIEIREADWDKVEALLQFNEIDYWEV